jgi:predicted nucleic acid-binding protein
MLAQETGADLVLIDERAGRREAARRGLSVAGTLAVLDEAAQRGLLDFDFAITRLRQTNFRLSPAILKAFTWR